MKKFVSLLFYSTLVCIVSGIYPFMPSKNSVEPVDIWQPNECNDTDLHIAARKGDYMRAHMILVAGIWPYALNCMSLTPGHYAFQSNNEDLIMAFLDQGFDINTRISKKSLSDYLLEVGSLDAYEHLFEHGVYFFNESPLNTCVEKRYFKTALKLIAYYTSAGVKIDTLNDMDGVTPVELATKLNDPAFISLFVANGVKKSFVTARNRGLLHVAVDYNSHDALKTLLELDFDPDFRPEGGKVHTPIVSAVHDDNVEVVEILWKNGANRKQTNPTAWGFMCEAARHNRLKSIKFFKSQGVDVNQKCGHVDNTPLHFAAFSGNLEAAKLLVKLGANHTLKNKDRFTPLDYTRIYKSNNNKAVQKFLVSVK